MGELKGKKKWLVYLAAFAAMVAVNKVSDKINLIDRTEAFVNETIGYAQCVDTQVSQSYYRLNCPICRAVISELYA